MTGFTIGAGVVENGIGFAIVGDATLQGTVWNDRDGNGEVGAAEVGVAGVTVVASWQGPNGPANLSTATDAFGRWEISRLPSAEYTISIDPVSLPDGMHHTGEPVVVAALGVGESVVADIGVAFVLDIGATVWIDSDGDGAVDAGETGIGNVLVNAYDQADNLVAIAETGLDGRFVFPDLMPGVYSVQLDAITVPEGLLQTHDPDGLADLSTIVDLTQGGDVLDLRFGFQQGLPVTGFNLAWFSLWGAILVMAGCALVTAAQSRRRFGGCSAAVLLSSP